MAVEKLSHVADHMFEIALGAIGFFQRQSRREHFARAVEITLAFIPICRFPEDAVEQNHRRIIARARAFTKVLPHQISCRIAPPKVKILTRFGGIARFPLLQLIRFDDRNAEIFLMRREDERFRPA